MGAIGALRSLLAEQREDGLAGLPRSTNIYMGETPRPDYRLPKGIEAFVFDQFIDPENLARLPNEQHRTVIMLLALTGVRVSSLLELGRDALQIGSDKHPYLLYVNAKHKREAALPIGPVLCEQLRRQEEYLQSIYGKEGTALMLPSPPPGTCPSGRGGAHPITEGMVRQIVKGYVRKAEIRDSKGALARWVHPHLFRHHLGTHLVNEKVPLRVIQKVLDHYAGDRVKSEAGLAAFGLLAAVDRPDRGVVGSPVGRWPGDRVRRRATCRSWSTLSARRAGQRRLAAGCVF